MKKSMKFYYCGFIALLLLIFTACGQKKKEKDKTRTVEHTALSGYDINNPTVYKMPAVLDEISGISFYNGNAETMYAEQDEEGRLFSFKPGDDRITETKFAKKGDFEDVQVSNGKVIMLRSDGRLYAFPLSEANGSKAADVKEFDGLLPDGEYESMYADRSGKKLYVLCKHCNEKASQTVTGYVLSMSSDGDIKPAGNFTINVADIAAKANIKKLRFEPSALAKNERTGEWFILSSVNKMIVVTTSDWAIREIYKLDPALYNQPEGLTFDAADNLYISNEKGSTSTATIFKITHRK